MTLGPQETIDAFAKIIGCDYKVSFELLLGLYEDVESLAYANAGEVMIEVAARSVADMADISAQAAMLRPQKDRIWALVWHFVADCKEHCADEEAIVRRYRVVLPPG